MTSAEEVEKLASWLEHVSSAICPTDKAAALLRTLLRERDEALRLATLEARSANARIYVARNAALDEAAACARGWGFSILSKAPETETISITHAEELARTIAPNISDAIFALKDKPCPAR